MKKGKIVLVNINNKKYEGCIIDFLTKEETKECKMSGQLIKVYIYDLKTINEFCYDYELTDRIDENYNNYIS